MVALPYNKTHMWHRITSTNKILQNPGAQTCSIIPFVDISPHISLSLNLCDGYLIISRSFIDYQLNNPSDWLLVHRFSNSSVQSSFCLVTMDILLNNRARDLYCLHTGVLKWHARRCVWALPHTQYTPRFILRSQYLAHL